MSLDTPSPPDVTPSDQTLDVTRLELSGDIDLDTVDGLVRQLGDAQRPGVPTVLDMSSVTFMDSTGLRALLSHRAEGHTLTIENPSRQVARLLELSELTSVFLAPASPID